MCPAPPDKTSNTAEELEKFGGIDIFWDGVGGETLDAALGAMRFGGRSIECGMISGYNKGGEPVAFKNIMKIIGSGITLRGFLVFEFEKEYQEEFYNTIPKMLASGEMKFTETVYKGLEAVPGAFVDLLEGKNVGKVVVKIA
jgi:NADPH-dependent curcumin reductase CurA